MSGIQHEFTDSESASFLHGEAKETPSRKEYLGGKAVFWRFWSPISRFLPYVLLMFGIFLATVIFFSAKEIQEKSLLPSQSMFGKSKTSIYACDPKASCNTSIFVCVWLKHS